MDANHSSAVPQAGAPPSALGKPNPLTADESRQELQQAIASSNQILFQASTVLALFPDSMIIDREKITIIKRSFYRTANIMSIRIEDVLSVSCSVGPFLARVEVTARVVNEGQSTTIGKFWRSDAKRLKRIGQGYVIALQRSIDCSKLGTSELATMLEEVGADNPPSA